MKITLLALAALAAVPALAEDTNKPYALINGRGVNGPSQPIVNAGAGAGNLAAAAQPSAFGTAAVAPGIVSQVAAAAAAAQGTPPVQGFKAPGARRPAGHRGIAGNRALAATATGGAGSEGAPPPYLSKPGALIRTEGQQPKYSDPGPAGQNTIEAGGFVDIDARKAHDVGKAPGVKWGAPDTRPSTNVLGGGSGAGSAGGNAITANGPAIPPDGKSDNGVGNAGTPGNGGQNNPNASVSGFDPSF